MKRIPSLFLAIIVSLFLPANVYATLTGNYTINPLLPASAGNYQNFYSAMNDLTFGIRSDGGPASGPGVSGPVVITVAAGTYNESVSLGDVSGTSPVNTITIDGVNSASCIVSWSSVNAGDFAFRIDGADYVLVKNMTIENTGPTYGYGMMFTNYSDYDTVSNCIIRVSATGTNAYQVGVIVGTYYSSYSQYANNLTLRNCAISGGYINVVCNGQSFTPYSLNHRILNCTLSGAFYTGVLANYVDRLELNGNTITGRNPGGSTSSYGIQMANVDEYYIVSNKINNFGSYGLYITNGNTAAFVNSYVVNNFIGGGFFSTSAAYSIYGNNVRTTKFYHNSILNDCPGGGRALYLLGSSTQNDLRNNAIVYNGTNVSGQAFYLGATSLVDTMENNFYGCSGGVLAYWNGLNHINLASLQASLPPFHQTCQSGNPNFISNTNLHTYGAPLANWAVNTPSYVVNTDIDGQVRPLPPDIIKDVGADEFNVPNIDLDISAVVSPTVLTIGNNPVTITLLNSGNNSLNGQTVTVQYSTNGGASWPVSENVTLTTLGSLGATQNYTFTAQWNVPSTGSYNFCTRIYPVIANDPDTTDVICRNICTGMSGAYSINPLLPTGGTNYNSFADAVSALNSCGISGPVTITAVPGTYNTQVQLGPVAGTSAVNTVTFDGVHPDSVIVTYALAAVNASVVKLDASKHFTFRNMTVRSTGSTGFGFHFTNMADSNQVINCKIQLPISSTSVYHIGVLTAGTTYSTAGDNADAILIKDCSISGGYYGVCVRGSSATVRDRKIRLENCRISEAYYYGVYAQYEEDFEMIGCKITGRSGGNTFSYGMYANYLEGSCRLESNTINVVGAYGMYLSSFNSYSLGQCRVVNNMIGGVYGNSAGYPIYASTCNKTDFYHNSLSAGMTAGTAFTLASSGTQNTLKNNIFYCGLGTGRTISIATAAMVDSMDCNGYYCPSSTMISFNAINFASVAAFHNVYANFETNGVQADPRFVSLMNLHIVCAPQYDNRGMWVGVGEDIDGQNRSLTTPDIGADEFSSQSVSISLGNDTIVCNGVTLHTDSLAWNNVQWTGQVFTASLYIDTTGQYSVSVTDSNNCNAVDTINITVYPGPIDPFALDTMLMCVNDTLNAGNPGMNYLWNNNSTNQHISVQNSGWYWVDIQHVLGCNLRDSVYVDLFAATGVNLGPDTAFCLGGFRLLNAGQIIPGQTYLWSTGATSQVIMCNAPGQYWVQVTTPNGCVATDTMNLNALLPPVVNLGPDRTWCHPETLLAYNAGSTYQWSTGSTNSQIIANAPGTYYVTVTSGNSCIDRDTVVLTQGAVPPVNLGPNQVICNGQSVSLDAGNPGATYLWSTGSTTQTISVSTPGIIIVNVTHPTSGCVASDTVEIAASPAQVNLGPDQVICNGQTITLTATCNGCVYNWSTGANSPTISVTQAGSYSVNVTDQLGCVATDQINIVQGTNLIADFSYPGTLQMLTAVNFTDLTTPVPNSWSWDFGDGGSSTQQNPAHTYLQMGPVTVCLTASDGTCSTTTCKTITIGAPTGMDEMLEAGLRLYPNPATETLYLEYNLNEGRMLDLRLCDLQGRTLRALEIDAMAPGKFSLSLEGFARGVYLVKAEARNGGIWVKKLVVE